MPRVYKKIPLEQRFWPKVTKSEDSDACWGWLAQIRNGYGAVSIGPWGAGMISAHHVSWVIHNGPMPENMFVLHKCDNKLCTNPKHLFLGTQLDNMRDKFAKGRHRSASRGGFKRAKLTIDDVREIRRSHANREDTYSGLGRIYGVTRNCIVSVVSQRTWRHIQ